MVDDQEGEFPARGDFEEIREKYGPKRRSRFTRSFSMSPIEIQMVENMAEMLGTSRSEIMRQAIHAYAGVLSVIWKKEQK